MGTPTEPGADGTGRDAPSARTRVRRLPERGVYDREAIDAILDQGLVCHVGFVSDGHPFVMPMAYARLGDTLFLHGSTGSRLARTLLGGMRACVTITILDGLVLARSGFEHSMNYRSVVVLGTAEEVRDDDRKLEALRAFVERMVPGRWEQLRPPKPAELRQTSVLAIRLDEASAKVRTGGAEDPQEDLAVRVWAGVVPLRLIRGEPIPDDALPPGLPPPSASLPPH